MTYGSQAHTVDVTVSPFGEEGGSDALTVTSSKSWILVSKPEWIGVTPEGGGKGITTLTLTAEASTATEERIGTIVVKTVDDRYVGYIHVTQEATSGPYLRINGSNDNYSTTGLTRGGQVEVTVGSKGGWHVDTASLPAGVTCSPTGVSDTAATSVTMTVAYPENTSTAGPKTVVVTLVNDSDPDITRTITITQPVRPYLTVTAVYPLGASKAAWDTGLATLRVESNTTGGIISSVEDFVYTGGTFTGNEDISVKMLNAATGNDRTFTISLSGGSADDVKVDASVTFTLEKEPVLSAGDLVIQSASTTGNTWYSTNYGISSTPAEGTPFYVTRMGLYTSEGQTRLRITATCVADWTDKQFPLYIVTTGTVGSSKTLEITCTKKAKVAELSANDTTTGKGGGTVTIPYTSNDNVNVSWGTLPAWVTSHTINTTNKTIILGVAENTGPSERDYTFTLTTEHNGAGGRPVSVNVKLTQSANNDRDTAVTINVFLKQDGDGYWHYMTTLDGNKFVSTDTLNFTMSLGSTTVSGDDNDPWTRTSYQNTAGTIVRPANFTPSSKSFDRGDGTDTYNITYSCPDANITPYKETVTGYANVTLYELSYLDDEVNAAGTETVRPTAYTVAYQEVITNSFDGTSRTGTTKYETLTVRNNNLSKLTGTTQNTGSFDGGIGVTAQSRGTTASTSTRDVATITGGTFSFSGNTYSTGIDVPKTIKQEKNVATKSENTTCGTTTTSYSNVKINLILRDNGTELGEDVPGVFNADGTTQKGASITTGIKAYAIETADQTKTTPYTAKTTWVYTSGAESSHTDYDTLTETDSVSYDRTSRITYTAVTGFVFHGGSSTGNPAYVTANNRGTTTGGERSETLSVTASHDSSKSDSEIVTQVANTTASTEWFNSGETTEIQNRACHLSCSPTAATFVNAPGGLSKTITAYSSADYDSVYTKRGDERTIYTSGASAKTRSNVVITSTTTQYRDVPVKPGGSWATNPPVASVTVSGPSQSTNTSAYTYVFTSSTPATAPTATTSDGEYRFTSPSGDCTADVAFSYSGTPQPGSITWDSVSPEKIDCDGQDWEGVGLTYSNLDTNYPIILQCSEFVTQTARTVSISTSSGYIAKSSLFKYISFKENTGTDEKEISIIAVAKGLDGDTVQRTLVVYQKACSTPPTPTYYQTLDFKNIFRTTMTTGSCGDFYPRCKVTVSLNGKTSKSVTVTADTKQNEKDVWVGNGDVDISSWNIPVGTTCTGTIQYEMLSESGGSWSPSSWSGSLSNVSSNTTTVNVSDINVVNLPSGAEGYFHFNCSQG